ncbi:MAG: hypothetical protein EXX96DRAFT_585123 [Benjaminiella poitrasii]|nr:MAG: hypothetical protein EXX96DRAFT_585123 [Benjaminiella poitrasii]
MGNCFGSESRDEGHQLKPTNLNNKKNNTKTKNGHVLGDSSDTPSSGVNSREAILNAAEKRRIEAENRGVKESGKLSKQLAEQKKQNQPMSPRNEVDDRLVWD